MVRERCRDDDERLLEAQPRSPDVANRMLSTWAEWGPKARGIVAVDQSWTHFVDLHHCSLLYMSLTLIERKA